MSLMFVYISKQIQLKPVLPIQYHPFFKNWKKNYAYNVVGPIFQKHLAPTLKKKNCVSKLQKKWPPSCQRLKAKMARNFQQLQHPPFRIAIEIEFSTENPNKIDSNQKVPSSYELKKLPSRKWRNKQTKLKIAKNPVSSGFTRLERSLQ